MSAVKVLVLRSAGTNCDGETIDAFQGAGATTHLVHLARAFERPELLHEHDILAVPGGFTYGDDIAAGAIYATQLRARMFDEISRFVADGKLVIGICNGFQILVKAGLLPAFDGPGERGDMTLAWNDSARFEDRWVKLRVDSSLSPFAEKGDVIACPVAHAEGKVVLRDDSVLDRLREGNQVVFTYVDDDGNETGYPVNPNGSVANIAGICDPTGRVLGLMPHPERNTRRTHHPRWTRGEDDGGAGRRIFERAVAYATG
jgi:phosphoribosylformylglycinamidine synthase